MKNIFIILFLGVCISAMQAQVTFQKTYGGGTEGKCYVVATSDGGYALAGSTNSYGAGGADVYLVRTDAYGNLLWTKTYGGKSDDIALAIEQTSDSGFIISGSTGSFGAGGFDVYLIRTDKNGDTLWSRTFGNTLDEDGWSVHQATDGGFFVAGDYGSSGYDYLIKTDSAGDSVWTKIYDQGKAFASTRAANGGYVVCGAVYSFISNGNDLFMYLTDSLGNVLWYKTYGGSNIDYGWQVMNANDGGFIAVGYSESFRIAGSSSVYVVKTDSLGELVWSKIYSGPGVNQTSSIASAGDGYVLLCPLSTGGLGVADQSLLIRIDNRGNVIWARNYTSCPSTNVVRTADGGFALAGNNSNFYLIKTDSLGNSGCSDSVTVITDTIPLTQVDSIVPNQIVGTITGSPATQISTGGIASTLCAATGIEPEISNALVIGVYPNPSAGQFTLNLPGNETYKVEIYNVLGQRIYQSVLQGTPSLINLNTQPSGLYFIYARDSESMHEANVMVMK